MLVNLIALVKAVQLGVVLRTLTKDVVPLVREARQVYETVQKRVRSGEPTKASGAADSSLAQRLEELRSRVERLEADGTKQADLIAQVATQVEALTQGLQLVARPMTAILITSAVAIIIAVVALVIAATR